MQIYPTPPPRRIALDYFLCYNLGMRLEIKRVKLTLLVLAVLIILSYAFFSMAEENSQTQNNIFMDSDQDGLTDQEESLYGTDPRSADTDHDGYSDGAEVKSGYDPLKPSPGDKIIISSSGPSDANTDTAAAEKNLTKEVAQKVATLTSTSDTGDQTITMDQVKSLVDDTLNQTVSDSDLPTISPDEIKIKKQNYSNLSKDAANEKRKEDFTNYIVGVYYILASNAPKPINSSDTVSGLANGITQEIVSAIEKQDPSQLQGLSDFGTKALDQLKTVEVPEDVVDIHIKALRFAKYAIALKDALKPNEADPLATIAQFSKIESFLQELMGFSADVESKFSSYGLQLDDALEDKITSLGVEIPQIDAAATAASSETSAASSDSAADISTNTSAN